MDAKTRLRAEAAAELETRRCARDAAYFIGRYVWIEDKTVPERVSRFNLWKIQQETLALFLTVCFIIALKARQLGFTWLALAYAAWRMIFTPGYTVVAISKTADDAKELVEFRLATIMFPRFPRWMIRHKKDAPKGWIGPVWEATTEELVIYHPNGLISRFKADAGSTAGASLTADLLILDEWALAPAAPEIWQSAFPIINRPGTSPESGQVFIISTNRRGTLFEQQVIDAREGNSPFQLVFWPWNADPRRDLAWYEDTKRLSPATYRQEYPASIDDALSAGEQTSFPEFDPREGGAHVCRPFPIPHWWRRWRSNDPGYTDPFAWYWFAADDTGEHVYIYREYTREPRDTRLSYSAQAAEAKRLSLEGTEVPGRAATVNPDTGEPVEERIMYTVTGMDAFNKHPETGKGYVDYYHEGGLNGFVEPVHGPGARAAMKATWHEYLKVNRETGKARLQIFSTCRKLIETIPQLVNDEKHPEQVAEMPIDHWYQAAGYGLQSWHPEQSQAPAQPLAPVAAAKMAKLKQLRRARARFRAR